MSLVLDSGALLAIERRDRRVGALLRVAQQERLAVRTSPAAVAQVWRHDAGQAQLAQAQLGQAQLAQVLAGVAAPPLDLDTGKRLGVLLGATHSCDVVDAHVASLARAGDRVLTSDPDDLRHLLDAFSIEATVVCV